ncbi:MAG: glutamate 5-kinase [Elusimicrobiota bacterium]|nr:glutamate 5-kinase [Elusimicrobiota bacterium]
MKTKKRIVVKVGTHLLTKEDGQINRERISQIVEDIAELSRQSIEVILVTSGAIATGANQLGLTGKLKTLREKQAAAAVGQPILMQMYKENFDKFNIPIAQVLLTREDFENRLRYLNARTTINCLLEMGVVPVINENDTVAVEEIQFGDNDTLSALVATKVEADALIMLTDVEGLFTDDPNKDSSAKLIRVVKEINQEIEQIAERSVGSQFGTGGMYTKVQSAKIATASGIETFIVDGRKRRVINDVVANKSIGTKFLVTKKITTLRKRWIAFGTKIKGIIVIDDGAVEALTRHGSSLLPSGIISVDGKFEFGDTVSIVSGSNKEIARGIVLYSSDEIERIKGKKSSEIASILGRCDFEEVIHRDNLVVL